MPQKNAYKYTATDSHGNHISGSVIASSEEAAKSLLADTDIHSISKESRVLTSAEQQRSEEVHQKWRESSIQEIFAEMQRLSDPSYRPSGKFNSNVNKIIQDNLATVYYLSLTMRDKLLEEGVIKPPALLNI